MKLLLIKILVTLLLVTLLTFVFKSSEKLAAFFGSLPILALLVMVWLYVEHQPAIRIAQYSRLTFWYVLPSLPFFLVFAHLVEKGTGFWTSLGLGLLSTLVSFGVVVWIARWFGVQLLR